MLVYVPQGVVALVYENGALHAVLEAGVGFVARGERGLEVQYVYLQPYAEPSEESEEPASVH